MACGGILTPAQATTYPTGMTRRLELQGHRGARGLFPENTVFGFAGALAIGVDTLELDAGCTADDVVVVTHDPRLNPDLTRCGGRWLDGPGPAIRSLHSAALAAYDVGRIRPGSTYAARYPDQTACDGARIPTLADVVRLDADVRFNVELKSFPVQPGLTVEGERMAEAVLAVADAAGVTDRLIVQSFDWRGPRRLRRLHPKVALAWLTQSATLLQARSWWDGPHPADFGGSVRR